MLKIENLSFAYPKGDNVFSDLSVTLELGNIYGLLGKNGAGKTTLLKLIAGLLFPQNGKSEVFGFIPKERHKDFLENVFFLPEEFYIPEITINEYEKLYAPFYRKFSYDSFHEYLKEFDLVLHKKLSEFSYGQKKKFLVAFALASNCKLVIFDEPTNGLDIPSKGQFRKLLASAISEDKTFIISTHQVRDLENLIDPIIILDEGKMIFHQSVAAITQNLAFVMQAKEPAFQDALYFEKTFGGFATVIQNLDALETGLDIEMLFKAVLANKERINLLFEGDKI